MDSKVNVISDSEHEIEIKVTYNEITGELSEALKEEQKKISLPGFRKGKVPMNMVKKMYGEAIEYQASEKIANKKFWELVDQKKLKPISTPQMTDLNFNPGKELSFKVKYEVFPKLKLKDYKNQTIDKPVFKVREEDVEKEIDNLLRAHSEIKQHDKVSDTNHRIYVNLQRLDKNSIPIVGGRNENLLFDLSDERINPKIIDGAVGKKVGDTFQFSFTEHHHDHDHDEHHHDHEHHHEGTEEYNFTAEITKIEKYEYPEITEELVKKMTGNKAGTMDELKALIRGNFEDYYIKQSENFYTNALLNTIVKNNDFEVPKGYSADILHRLVEYEKENAKRQKINSFDEKNAAEYLKPKAEWNAKWQIIYDNIASQENIKVEDSEIDEMVKTEAEKTGISEKKLMKFYKDSNRIEALLEEKVIKYLKENNVVNEFDPAEKAAKEKKPKNKNSTKE